MDLLVKRPWRAAGHDDGPAERFFELGPILWIRFDRNFWCKIYKFIQDTIFVSVFNLMNFVHYSKIIFFR
jgi:hypothetical protein